MRLFSFLVCICLITSCNTKEQELIVCGDGKVLILDPIRSEGEDITVKWQWDISEAVGLPEIYQKYLFPLDECKPVDNNTKLLITASGGGVVLLERKTKKILFYANAPMAHSADCLPANRIVVALSTHPHGNSVELYDIHTPEKCIFRDTLFSGHGVVWMPGRERLFALGEYELRAYSLKNWDTEQPELYQEKSWKLPAWGGHDLVSISNDELIVTVAESVWVFNINSEQFDPFLPVNVPDVKAINYNKKTGSIVYTKAEISWWTHHIHMQHPDKVITIPDVALYKVRIYPK